MPTDLDTFESAPTTEQLEALKSVQSESADNVAKLASEMSIASRMLGRQKYDGETFEALIAKGPGAIAKLWKKSHDDSEIDYFELLRHLIHNGNVEFIVSCFESADDDEGGERNSSLHGPLYEFVLNNGTVDQLVRVVHLFTHAEQLQTRAIQRIIDEGNIGHIENLLSRSHYSNDQASYWEGSRNLIANALVNHGDLDLAVSLHSKLEGGLGRDSAAAFTIAQAIADSGSASHIRELLPTIYGDQQLVLVEELVKVTDNVELVSVLRAGSLMDAAGVVIADALCTQGDVIENALLSELIDELGAKSEMDQTVSRLRIEACKREIRSKLAMDES